VSLGGRPRKDRKPVRCEPMNPVTRVHFYQAARGLPLSSRLACERLAIGEPVGLTGRQRRRWLHKILRHAARAGL
jgi:hypothetical protein